MNASRQNHLVRYCLWISAVFMFNVPLFAADTNQWNVEVIGMRVITPPLDPKGNWNGALMSPPGVAVEIRLTPPDGKIVNIDQFASKLDSFTDDKGTDLLAVKTDNPFNKPGFGMMDSGKGIYATADVQAAGLPAKGATALNLSGKVVLEIANGTNQYAVQDVEIKTNSVFNLGDLSLTISNVGTNHNLAWTPDYKYSVLFSSPRNLHSIASLKFCDLQGNQLDARNGVYMTWPDRYLIEYLFKQEPKKVDLDATCWQNIKTVEVPFSIKTSVGL